ncbi:MAG TPA: folate-binding protein YgfZ [Oxalobacteraceae bacterium]|nr:folate-binding protein YgfZ [Oxalobacteraceae bacterium]
MTPWLEFLMQQGAHLATGISATSLANPPDTALPQIHHFGTTAPSVAPRIDFVAPLVDLGLIALTGDDAPAFLHNQLTNDVEHLGQAEARLAGYCSPKGRLLATMLMWKSADRIMLQLPRQIQPALQKRLQMFVLRANAKLADVSDSYAILGLAGPAATAALSEWFPAMPAAPYAKTESIAGTLIRHADASGVARYQWVSTPQTAEDAWPKLVRTLQSVGPQVWRLTDIDAAIPQITLPTQEQFVPQMVNFEVIGGVNFKKGCYPGQEIVARSQYLGKLKRRMMLASVASNALAPGMEVFSQADPAQPCGMIVNAEPVSAGQMDCLVEIKVAALDAGSVHAGSADGPVMDFKPLPYAFSDPTA